MPKTLIPAAASATQINPSLIAFKPRQVLLASYSKSNMTTADKNEENKSLLRHSIAQYLQKNGLSKTLKKFRSEAQLEVLLLLFLFFFFFCVVFKSEVCWLSVIDLLILTRLVHSLSAFFSQKETVGILVSRALA